MTGKILGFDTASNIGTISADNGERYSFTNDDWKESTITPRKDMKVDFEQTDEKIAKDIYVIKDQAVENTSTILGLAAVAVTFFFGFIGTFVSRLFIAKESISNSIIPTLIHFVITLLIFIPVLGWFIYIIASFYFMYKNYMLVTQPKY